MYLDLILLMCISLLASILAYVIPASIPTIVLGLAFLLACPGYALVAALYPGKDGMNSGERLALSLGLSIAILPLIGLVINYTPWGVSLNAVLIATTSFIGTISWISLP